MLWRGGLTFEMLFILFLFFVVFPKCVIFKKHATLGKSAMLVSNVKHNNNCTKEQKL